MPKLRKATEHNTPAVGVLRDAFDYDLRSLSEPTILAAGQNRDSVSDLSTLREPLSHGDDRCSSMNGPHQVPNEGEVHSIRLWVLGLTGIAVDADGVSPVPKHIRAVVAVTRDSVRYGFSVPSRRLVKVPKHQHFVAIWEETSNQQHDGPAAIEFEATIEPLLRRSLHRNFELVIGVTSSSHKQPSPIGAASLPLQQAVALRSRETGRIVLDLPVFNLSSLKNNPFAVGEAMSGVGGSSVPKEKNGMFRSLSMRHQRSGTTASSSTTPIAPLWSCSGETVPNQCPFRMDPGRDAAILRIELEIKSSNNLRHQQLPKSPSNLVLVQPQDDGIEASHSVAPKVRPKQPYCKIYEPSSTNNHYHRVKIVDQTTMDCDIAPVVARSVTTEEYESPPTLASSSGELSSVENHMVISPNGVERVLSDDDRYISVTESIEQNDNQRLNGTVVPNSVESPRSGEVPVETTSRKSSFRRLVPRLRSGSTPTTFRSASRVPGRKPEPERCSSVSEGPWAKKQPGAHNIGSVMYEQSSPIPHRPSADPSLSSMSPNQLPVVIDSRTAAPETFEPTPVHFTTAKPTDTIQFALAMNLLKSPPPAKKKPEIEESIPMGSILQLPSEEIISEKPVAVAETGLVSSINHTLTKHWRNIFTDAEENDDERSTPVEDETIETYRRPAFRDDIVDLVAAFGDMCRPMNASALDDSFTDGPTWLDDDDQDDIILDDDVLSGEDEEDSNFSEHLLVDLQRDEGTEVDVSKALPLHQGYQLPVRKRSFVNFLRDRKGSGLQDTLLQPKTVSLNLRPEMIASPNLPPTQQNSPQASTPPKKLKSVLKNGHITSPILVVPEEPDEELDPNEEPEPNKGSPDCVTQPQLESTSFAWKPPSWLLASFSMAAQNLVDFVSKAMSPPEPPEEPVPVPAVFLEARDTVSVGDLTATTHEIQVDMNEFKKLIEEHLEQAHRDKKEYINGHENMFDITEDELEQIGSDVQEDAGSSEWED